MLAGSDVDFLDPGHTYFTQGYMVVYPTQRTLYSFKPTDSTKPVPDLAESDPVISADKKTVTVKIRPGVKFSPPVNREVTSKDVKYSFERFFSINVGGQYPAFFSSIEGAPSEPTKGVKPISGIETPDDNTIVFKLKEAAGVPVAAALVMPISAPVPEEYASKFDSRNPSTYNTHVVATGPYMVKNDADGNTIGYKAGKSIDLVRNPNWDAKTDYRPAYLDEVEMRTNASDANVASEQVLSGTHMLFDANPPANIIKKVATQIKDQYVQVPSGGYRYFPMTTTIKPFDNVNVRRAVLAGFDRNAARLARGGKFTADLADALPAAGLPGLRGGGWLRRPRLRLPQHEERVGRPGARRRVHEEGRLPVGQVHRERGVPDGQRQRRSEQGAGRGRQGAVREARLQDPSAARAAGRGLQRLVPGPVQEGRRLWRRRLVQGLRRSAVDARAGVRGLHDPEVGVEQQHGPAA